MKSAHEITILVIEDDPGHSRLIEKNLLRANVRNNIIIKGDGQEALDFLFASHNGVERNEMPSIMILLDLNLPGINGINILKQLKENSATKHIPIIILTTSDDINDVNQCYELGCNVYITKPLDYEKFSDAIKKLGFFISVVQVPERS